MRDALGDLLCQEPYEIQTAAKQSLWGLATVPAAVAALIGTNPVPSPATGSVAGGNVTLNAGITPFAVPGLIRRQLLEIKALPVTISDTNQSVGTQILAFPKGQFILLGAIASIAITTTSVLANTLNTGVTVACSVGTVTAANAALTSTYADIIPSFNLTASATINVPGATASTKLATALQMDGTGTAKSGFLNLYVAGATDIDADATVLVDGFLEFIWAPVGPYRVVNGA